MEKDKFHDQVVIVTGASAGTGRALALELAHQGAKVSIAARRIDQLEEVYSKFFLTLTKDEFFQGCLEKDMLGYPVMTAREILEDEQLKARGIWQEVKHEELGDTLTYPAFFTLFSSIACGFWRRAPLIGEHNEEIFGEIGLTKNDLLRLKKANVI